MFLLDWVSSTTHTTKILFKYYWKALFLSGNVDNFTTGPSQSNKVNSSWVTPLNPDVKLTRKNGEKFHISAMQSSRSDLARNNIGEAQVRNEIKVVGAPLHALR